MKNIKKHKPPNDAANIKTPFFNEAGQFLELAVKPLDW